MQNVAEIDLYLMNWLIGLRRFETFYTSEEECVDFLRSLKCILYITDWTSLKFSAFWKLNTNRNWDNVQRVML